MQVTVKLLTAALGSRPLNPLATKLGEEEQQTREAMIVKRIMIALACALIAPLAFAQTSTTTTEQTTTATQPTTTTETTTTYTAGTVTTYEPGKTLVVKSDQGPVSFALGTAARIVDTTGKVVTAPLRAGQKVRVYYAGPTESRTVERVIVEE